MEVGDLPLVLAWRTNPEISETLTPDSAPLTWDEHYALWKLRRDRVDWIVEVQTDDYGKRPVGSVNARLDHPEPELGVFVGETTLWGRGVGRAAVEQMCRWLASQGHRAATAYVRIDNQGSLQLFAACGFGIVPGLPLSLVRFRREL